jgi:hypothetical protein
LQTGPNRPNLFQLKRRFWADKLAFVPRFAVCARADHYHDGLLSLKEGGGTSVDPFATRQCDALTLARSIEEGVSAKCLSDSNAVIRPLCDSRSGNLRAGELPLIRFCLSRVQRYLIPVNSSESLGFELSSAGVGLSAVIKAISSQIGAGEIMNETEAMLS